MAGGLEARRSRAAVGAWWRAAQWYVVAGGAALAFALGVVGFLRHFEAIEQPRSLADAIYLALQLFTLESGSVEPPVPLSLQAARFLAPGVTVLGAVSAAVALLGERLARLRLRFARDHVVVCGLGDRGSRIAEEFLAAGHTVAVVELAEDEPHVAQARDAGAVVLIGDASDDLALRQARAHRARYVVAVCPEDGTNAAIAVQLAGLRRSCKKRRPVTAIVHVRNTELSQLLTQSTTLACGSDGLRLEFFNVPTAGAAAMLASALPVSRDPASAPHVAIVGLGRLGRSLAVQVARSWWVERDGATAAPVLTLVDPAVDSRLEMLRTHAPRLDEACVVRPVALDIDASGFERGTFLADDDALPVPLDVAYVCVDDDAQALAAALALRHLTRAWRTPIVVRMRSNDGLAALAMAGVADFGDLHAVGILDATCSLSALLGGVNESVARAVHADYVRRQRAEGSTVAENPSMAAWDDLTEDLRESNRRQADDIGAKLRSVGMVIVPRDDWAHEPDAFTDAEVEQLARAEHDRWVAERTAQGWRYAPGKKDVVRKTSPHLVPWAELKDEKVRDLDRDAVRAIPALLAGAGLSMERTAPA